MVYSVVASRKENVQLLTWLCATDYHPLCLQVQRINRIPNHDRDPTETASLDAAVKYLKIYTIYFNQIFTKCDHL